jgi:hypothetical protein
LTARKICYFFFFTPHPLKGALCLHSCFQFAPNFKQE